MENKSFVDPIYKSDFIINCCCVILDLDYKICFDIFSDDVVDSCSLEIIKKENFKIQIQNFLNNEEFSSEIIISEVEDVVIKCIRKVGCKCKDCIISNPESQVNKNKSTANTKDNKIETLKEFITSSKHKRINFILTESDQFHSFLKYITEEDVVTTQYIISQEKFLFSIYELISFNPIMLQLGILKSQTLKSFIKLSFGYSDTNRWRAVQIMLELANKIYSSYDNKFSRLNSFFSNFNYPTQDEEMRLLSDKIYSQLYDMDKWIDYFSDISPATLIVKLTGDEIKILRKVCYLCNEEYFKYEKQQSNISGGCKFPHPWYAHVIQNNILSGKITKDEVELFDLFKEKLKKLIFHNFQTSFFIKLSTRSPKDSKLLKIRYNKLLQNCMQNNDGADLDHIRDEATRLTYKFDVLDTALDAFFTSERIEDDLDSYLKFIQSSSSTTEGNISIILREFIEGISPFSEIRGFVHNYYLTALTQYQDDKEYLFLKRNKDKIQEIITQFYENKVKNCLKNYGFPNAVIDFGLILGENEEISSVILIELNSFGFRSGSGFFDWSNEQDYEILIKGPFTFRII